MNRNYFVKSHGLGNEYIVLDKENLSFNLNENAIKTLCNINFGIGSDGILLKVNSDNADFGLKIFNPDGSEAEKSGNGLRIFSKYIYDYKFTNKKEFTVETKGGIVKAKIIETSKSKAKIISISIGKAKFDSKFISNIFQSSDEIFERVIQVDNKKYEINCVSIGNPHCVILKENLNINEIKEYGQKIENHKIFSNRINVQFAKILSKNEVEILIWERGAGFTLASGTSSCAVASVLKRKNLINNKVNIKMLGGELIIEIDANWNIKMTGKVRQIAEGTLSDELLEDFYN